MSLTTNSEVMVADRIDGLPQPFEHGHLFGQEEAIETFLKAAQSNRLHHAWMLIGSKGSGKATFAFHMARYFVGLGQDLSEVTLDGLINSNQPDGRDFKQIAAGAHPNVLHMRVPYDEQAKKFKTQLTVDEVRKTVRFFSSTAGEDGWRVAIVDSLDELNINAANALLKILEEPPKKTLFFLLSERPGRVLPTIKSRCRTLAIKGLSNSDLASALSILTSDFSASVNEISENTDMFEGSVRKAYLFFEAGNTEIKQAFQTLIANPDYDIPSLHKFADVVSERGQDDRYSFFIDYLETILSDKIKNGSKAEALVRIADVWEKVHEDIRRSERYNLDRKQTVLSILNSIKPALRP